jgi:hypothetical protein
MIAATSALPLPHRAPRWMPRTPLVHPDERPRFTVDGSDALETHLAQTCEKIAAGLRGLLPPHKLQAVLLGGGYGRGEGGVWRTAPGDRPYNDLEFYVFLRGNRHLNEWRFGRALHVLGEILTPQAGIEVEFKIAALPELARAPVSMFSYDLLVGHRCVFGPEELFAACAHHREAGQIPIGEATRLLMNRCSGLLLAQERLQREPFTAGDADFVRRNIAKAELALGDAVLTAYGQYHWSARERHLRLERIARAEGGTWIEGVVRHHAAGVEFKLHPERSDARREELQPRFAAVSSLALRTWQWVEERRLRRPVPNARSYAELDVDLWPGASPARNALQNVKIFGAAELLRGRARRHPRQRVIEALVLLLWEPAALSEPALLRRIQCALQTQATTFPALVAAYRRVWSQVS